MVDSKDLLKKARQRVAFRPVGDPLNIVEYLRNAGISPDAFNSNRGNEPVK